jgi:hypothetical protein
MNHSYEVFFDDVPTFFIEMQGETIRARSFVVLELVQESKDFCFLDGFVKEDIVKLSNL